MSNFPSKGVAIITGASSGIGAAYTDAWRGAATTSSSSHEINSA